MIIIENKYDFNLRIVWRDKKRKFLRTSFWSGWQDLPYRPATQHSCSASNTGSQGAFHFPPWQPLFCISKHCICKILIIRWRELWLDIKKGSSFELPFSRDDRICLAGRLRNIVAPLQILIIRWRELWLDIKKGSSCELPF